MGMKKEEYLKELTKQLHYAPVRKVVSQEYIDHIEDETEYQISKGMDPDEAESYAVEQMGDPVEVGKQLDEIHRPKNIRIPLSGIIFIVAVCAVFSYFMQKDYYEVLSELIGEPKSAVTILFWGNLIVSVGNFGGSVPFSVHEAAESGGMDRSCIFSTADRTKSVRGDCAGVGSDSGYAGAATDQSLEHRVLLLVICPNLRTSLKLAEGEKASACIVFGGLDPATSSGI